MKGDRKCAMRFRILVAAILGLATAVLPAAAAGNYESYGAYLESLYRDTVPLVEPEELLTLADSGDAPLVVLDVRTPEEQSVSHIAGARLLTYDKFTVADVADVPRSATIVLYCAVGFRSERAGEELLAAGYERVFNLYGGIIEWRNRGLPLAGGSGLVHGHSPRWGRWVADGSVTYDPKPM